MAGVGAHFFFDLDNDGDLDALNGNGMDDPETTDDDWAVSQKMKLYINQGYEGDYTMKDEAFMRGIQNTKENRGAMVFDFDSDGDLDVLVINHADKPSLYRNEGATITTIFGLVLRKCRAAMLLAQSLHVA